MNTNCPLVGEQQGYHDEACNELQDENEATSHDAEEERVNNGSLVLTTETHSFSPTAAVGTSDSTVRSGDDIVPVGDEPRDHQITDRATPSERFEVDKNEERRTSSATPAAAVEEQPRPTMRTRVEQDLPPGYPQRSTGKRDVADEMMGEDRVKKKVRRALRIEQHGTDNVVMNRGATGVSSEESAMTGKETSTSYNTENNGESFQKEGKLKSSQDSPAVVAPSSVVDNATIPPPASRLPPAPLQQPQHQHILPRVVPPRGMPNSIEQIWQSGPMMHAQSQLEASSATGGLNLATYQHWILRPQIPTNIHDLSTGTSTMIAQSVAQRQGRSIPSNLHLTPTDYPRTVQSITPVPQYYATAPVAGLTIVPPRLLPQGGNANMSGVLGAPMVAGRLPSQPVATFQHPVKADFTTNITRAQEQVPTDTAIAEPPPATITPSPASLSVGVCMYLPCDDENLSNYQVLVRKQLEYFEASQNDENRNVQGRKKKVCTGQVGIRCIHCHSLLLHHQQHRSGSVYFPVKLMGIYQAAQNMAATHLNKSCPSIDSSIREELNRLRQQKPVKTKGGRQYWADSAKVLGIYETNEGLKMSVRES